MNQPYAKNQCQKLTPIYVPGEAYTFYINFDSPISDPNFASFELCVYKGVQLKAANIGILQKDMVKAPFYNLFCLFNFPALADGTYQFVIIDSSNNTEKCRSNNILVVNNGYLEKTSLAVFRDDRAKYGVNYEGLPDFYQVFRLPLFKIDYQYESERTQYRNVSNDRMLRNLADYVDKLVKIESYKFDEDAHDAAAAMYDHYYIYIDEQRYVTKDSYQVDTNLSSVIPKGSVNAYLISDAYNFTYDPNPRATEFAYIAVGYGNSKLTMDANNYLTYTDDRLAGKTNYPVYSTQIPNFLTGDQIQYNASGFTIKIPGFALIGTGYLYIFPNADGIQELPIPQF